MTGMKIFFKLEGPLEIKGYIQYYTMIILQKENF